MTMRDIRHRDGIVIFKCKSHEEAMMKTSCSRMDRESLKQA